jgi:mannose-6-phosphate isomerase-like protein (cupin superfamily)
LVEHLHGKEGVIGSSPIGGSPVMAHAGQEIEGVGGFRLRIVRLDDELLEMEASYAGDGVLPPEHLHPSQAERFEVLEGTIRAIIAGVEHRFEPGETFDVPVATPHQMTAETPARVNWQVRPPLRTAEFFERLFGDGPDSAAALGADFVGEFSDEIRFTAG